MRVVAMTCQATTDEEHFRNPGRPNTACRRLRSARCARCAERLKPTVRRPARVRLIQNRFGLCAVHADASRARRAGRERRFVQPAGCAVASGSESLGAHARSPGCVYCTVPVRRQPGGAHAVRARPGLSRAPGSRPPRWTASVHTAGRLTTAWSRPLRRSGRRAIGSGAGLSDL